MKKIPKMPAPPDFLLQKNVESMMQKSDQSNQNTKNGQQNPRTVDFILYQTAIDERKAAEIQAAEIYSKYLELVNFSESLIKKINRFDVYKAKVRSIYNTALMGDQIIKDNLQLTRIDLENTKKLIQDLNIENQAMRASVDAHQEAFTHVTIKMGQAEAAMEHANSQFQLLSEEYEKRGTQVVELEKKLNGLSSQLKEIGEKLIDSQKKSDFLSDENLLIQNQLRESQIKEMGLATLNQELTDAIPKLQKQIHILEEKLRQERDEYSQKSAIMTEEIERLRENKLIDSLVVKSKQTLEPQPENQGGTLKDKVQIKSKEQWNEFYHKWSAIIDELSSHSAPIRKEKQTELPPLPQLVSEHGDLDF
ncbi:MAG: hypothetical protein IPM57_02935 [Oligoflexia bacterium]|nr:hypothetical protein [Oligoflexia bacterium]